MESSRVRREETKIQVLDHGYNMRNRRLLNVANPISDTDAVNLGYVKQEVKNITNKFEHQYQNIENLYVRKEYVDAKCNERPSYEKDLEGQILSKQDID